MSYDIIHSHAGVMELADVTDSKSVGLIPRAGSTPATGIKHKNLVCPDGVFIYDSALHINI